MPSENYKPSLEELPFILDAKYISHFTGISMSKIQRLLYSGFLPSFVVKNKRIALKKDFALLMEAKTPQISAKDEVNT